MRRKGSLIFFGVMGFMVVGGSLVASIMFINYVETLEIETEGDSQYIKDGSLFREEVLNAQCTMEGRGILDMSFFDNPDLSCIGTYRDLGVEYTVVTDDGTRSHRAEIPVDGEPEAATEAMGPPNIHYPVVAKDTESGDYYRGNVSVHIGGDGTACEAGGGTCEPVDTGNMCSGATGSDCGLYEMCCGISIDEDSYVYRRAQAESLEQDEDDSDDEEESYVDRRADAESLEPDEEEDSDPTRGG